MSRYALYTPDNRLPWTEALSYWTQASMTVADSTGDVVAPDGTYSAKKIIEINSGNHYVAVGVSDGGFLVGRPIWIEFYWREGESPRGSMDAWENGGRLLATVRVGSGGYADTLGYGFLHTDEELPNGWRRIIVVSSLTFQNNYTHVDFYFHARDPSWSSIYDATSGNGYYVWHPRVGTFEAPYFPTTGSQLVGQCVMLEPSWETEIGRQKFADVNRTPTGRRRLYDWGTKQRFKLPVEFLNHDEAMQVHSWQRSVSSLYLLNMDSYFDAPVEVFIGGDKSPLAPMPPYDHDYGGVIELEEF